MKRSTVVSLIVLVAVILLGEVVVPRIPLGGEFYRETHYFMRIDRAREMRDGGDIAGATAELKAAIRDLSNGYSAYINLAETLLQAGETNAALSNYDLAIAHCGKSPTNFASIPMQLKDRVRIERKARELRDAISGR